MSDETHPVSGSDAPASSGSSIRRSSSSSRSRKKKKNQLPMAAAAVAIVVAIGVLLSVLVSERLGLFWFTGIAFGYILQRSRFCFTASMRDPFLTGGTNLTKAVLIAFAITSIGFTAIKYGAAARGLPIPGQSYVAPISATTAIGAFMFGIGMVIAGGCASGTLMRVGEGFLMQIIVVIFFVVGSLWGAHDFGFWRYNVIRFGGAVFLPDIFGWVGALTLQLVLIAFLYVMADRWSKRKQKELGQ